MYLRRDTPGFALTHFLCLSWTESFRKYLPIPLLSKSSLTSHSILAGRDRNSQAPVHHGIGPWHWPMTLVLKTNILFQLAVHQEENTMGVHKTEKLLALLEMFNYSDEMGERTAICQLRSTERWDLWWNSILSLNIAEEPASRRTLH